VLTSKRRIGRAGGVSIAAMLLVALAGAPAAAQSGPDTAATATWKTAAASAASSAPATHSAGSAPIAEAAASSAPVRGSAETAAPSNMVPTPPVAGDTQTGTAEIPPADSPDPSSRQPVPESNDVVRYEQEQSGMPPDQLRGMQQQFNTEGELSTPFGMQLREARRTLKSGEEADGLLITVVENGSPAAAAGLQAYNHKVHDALAAAAMVGAVFSGGLAVVVIPALDYMQVGESYDLIIGVDGSRVTNFLDFQDRMRDLQPGEVVYLSVVRNGKRMQVTMPVPANILQANN
jgi:hypothetical protein